MTENLNTINLEIEGMTCTNCALGVRKVIEKSDAKNVSVDFSTGEAIFDLKSKETLSAIINNIQALGYSVKKEHVNNKESKWSPIEIKFFICLVFTLPLMLHMILPFHFLHNPLVQIALTLPVMFVGGWHFMRSAITSLKAFVPNMDVLIAIGSTSAFIYSLSGTIMYYGTDQVHTYLFYETAASIITLVLLGNVIEHRSVKQTTTALKELTAHQTVKAKKIEKHGDHEHIHELDFLLIKKGDLLLLNTGDKVPVDGHVNQGMVTIDESMITGEAMPVTKGEGSTVVGGTIILDGNARMIADAVGKDTVLSQIIEMVKRSQQSKPSIQKLGDKVSAVFVPVVLGISALTFLLAYYIFNISAQQALMNSIAVLVISCPCAMGLATPTAVMAGIGRAAKNGILIKGGSTLELFAKIKTIVFDKTGTLTTGNFKITDIVSYENTNLEIAKNVICEMEKFSSHPIAVSIVHELKDKITPIRLNDVQEIKGLGMTAKDSEGNKYQLGSAKISSQTNHKHTLYLIRNDKLIAGVNLQDELKSNVIETLDYFEKENIKTVLLSGDKKENCDALTAKAKFSEVHSEQSPIQKIEKLGSFSVSGESAMVGDGINDAAALAKASVGVSFSGATQIAIQSAQIVLLNKHDLASLELAHRISKHTLKTIKQNLFWAFFYNVVAIPIAAMGFLTPTIGAFTMAFSDVVVIGNSILLKTKKLK